MPDRVNALERLLDFAIGGGAIEAIRYIFNRKKNEAETDKQVSGNWKEYAEHMEGRFNLLMDQHEILTKKYNELERKYQELDLQFHAKNNSNSRPRRS